MEAVWICGRVWGNVHLCVHEHTSQNPASASESRISYKSLKNYSRIIAQLTFSFFPTRQRNPCPHSLFPSLIKWTSLPLLLSFSNLPTGSEQNDGCLTLLRTIRISTKTYKKYPGFIPLMWFSTLMSPLFVRADLIYGGEYRTWRGTMQG